MKDRSEDLPSISKSSEAERLAKDMGFEPQIRKAVKEVKDGMLAGDVLGGLLWTDILKGIKKIKEVGWGYVRRNAKKKMENRESYPGNRNLQAKLKQ